MMKPGDRVTMKNDRRTHYGTVIEGQLRDNEGLTFVIWDRTPERFHHYGCGELRLTRPGEEKRNPEGSLETREDFQRKAEETIARIYIGEDGKSYFPLDWDDE